MYKSMLVIYRIDSKNMTRYLDSYELPVTVGRMYIAAVSLSIDSSINMKAL